MVGGGVLGSSQGTVPAKKQTPRVISQCLNSESSLGFAKLFSRDSFSWYMPQEGSIPGTRTNLLDEHKEASSQFGKSFCLPPFLKTRKQLKICFF